MWWVVLPTGETLPLRDAAIATSGHSERFAAIAGCHYSHAIDPQRNQPVSTEITTVSILAPTAIEADALTKPFFIWKSAEQEGLLHHSPNVRA